MTDKPITDEALAEIEAGLEWLPNSPWKLCTSNSVRRVTSASGIDGDVLHGGDTYELCAPHGVLEHIARVDPATVRALIARIRAAEAERDRLREALKPFAEIAAQLDRDNPSPLANDATVPANTFFNMGELRAARAFMEEGE